MNPTELLYVSIGAITLCGLVVRLALNVYRWASRVEDAILYVESEMRMNGGSTTRDAISRIEHHLGIEVPS